MPRYQQVAIGLKPETIETLDQLWEGDNAEFKSRSAAVRHFIQQGLDDGEF